ncbi:hypothetical protein PZN02_000487 [Sinorhizobium garamanticum]|uniref:Uncharacterized protein n=1 Tax=Sinorhizobium garamanticum TaxID=680247 RepID=A0ABY8DAY3_9HYPH|nr:hypothetical protein [Sinorhizobium garamanticum]WEX88035.1 hypothetical protein PZN02_000487 [Sinorhizobium garamanticum]
MKIPSRHIWKSVTEVARHNAPVRRHNLHIGRTMRDLHIHTEEKRNKRLQALLDALEKAEKALPKEDK